MADEPQFRREKQRLDAGFLGAEVAPDGPFREPGGRGDVITGSAVDAMLDEQIRRVTGDREPRFFCLRTFDGGLPEIRRIAVLF